FNTSQFTQGLKFCDQLERDSSLSFQDRFRTWIFKLRFLEKLGHLAECLTFADILLENQKIIADNGLHAEILTEIAKALFSKGILEEVISTIQQAEELLVDASNIPEPDLERIMADLILLRGGYCWQQGNLEDALYYFKFNLSIRQNSVHARPLDIANALNNVGVLYNANGKLAKSLTYLKQGYELYQEVGNTRGISKAGHNIGAILVQMGELNEALKYMLQSMNSDLTEKYMDGIRVASQNIGEIFWHKREYTKALQYLEEGLSLSENAQNDFSITEICVPLIAVHLELPSPDRITIAKKYHNRILQISIKSSNKIIHQREWLAQALILKAENTSYSIKLAETYLDLIIEDGVRYFDITVMALVSLSEILLTQLELASSEHLLQKLGRVLTQLISLAEESHSFSIQVEALLLKAKLLQHQNHKESHLYFQQALTIAKSNNLKRIEKKILDEYDQFLEFLTVLESKPKNIDKTHEILTKSQSRQMKWQIRNIFAPESGELPQKAVTQAHAFYLMDNEGRELLQTKFGSDPKWENDSLFSRIFQIDFIKRIAQFTQNSIEINRYNEYKLMFIRGNKMIGCLVYSGSSSLPTEKMEQVRGLLSISADATPDLLELEPQLKVIFSTLSAV
ncbi:MAG: tetratricopeptide repeat protein, partial [Promethearchaeota archaeon]